MRIESVNILAPADSPNTDGLDPSGWNYEISGCTFDVGDDCIAVKPTGDPPAGHVSCEDLLIERCLFRHGHGLSIGGQTRGGLRRMTVRDCTFDGTNAGIRMKAGRGSGGVVNDVSYENLVMTGVNVPILISSYYPKIPADPANDPSRPVDATTPQWRNIRIVHLTSTGSPTAGQIIGLPEMPIDDVVLRDVHLTAERGLTVINATRIRFEASTPTVKVGPPLLIHNSDVREVDDAAQAKPAPP